MNKILKKIVIIFIIITIFCPYFAFAYVNELQNTNYDIDEFLNYYQQVYEYGKGTKYSDDYNRSVEITYENGNFTSGEVEYVETNSSGHVPSGRLLNSATYTTEELLKLYIYSGVLLGKDYTFDKITSSELDSVISQIKSSDPNGDLFNALKSETNQKKLKDEVDKLQETRNQIIEEFENASTEDIYYTSDGQTELNLTDDDKKQINSVDNEEEIETGEGLLNRIFGSIVNYIASSVVDFLTNLVDALMNFIQEHLLPGSYVAIDTVGSNNYNLKYYKSFVGSEAAVLFAEPKSDATYNSTEDVNVSDMTLRSVPHIYIGVAAILTNHVPALNANFFTTDETNNPIFETRTVEEYAQTGYKIYQSQEQLQSSVTSTLALEKVEDIYQRASDSQGTAIINKLRPIVRKWYISLRNLVILCLSIVLVYIGIRIIMSTPSGKVQYRQMFLNWIKSVIILFTTIYAMTLAWYFIDILVNSFSYTYNVNTGDYLMNYVRTKIAICSVKGDFSTQFGLTVIYFIAIYYTLIFAFQYFKRVFYLALLTLISPMIALSYSIDKASDGQAQAFSKWMKEYAYQLIIQPLQLIVYVIFVSTAIEMVLNGGNAALIMAVIALTFVRKAENILKWLFNVATPINGEPFREPEQFNKMVGDAGNQMRTLLGHGKSGFANMEKGLDAKIREDMQLQKHLESLMAQNPPPPPPPPVIAGNDDPIGLSGGIDLENDLKPKFREIVLTNGKKLKINSLDRAKNKILLGTLDQELSEQSKQAIAMQNKKALEGYKAKVGKTKSGRYKIYNKKDLQDQLNKNDPIRFNYLNGIEEIDENQTSEELSKAIEQAKVLGQTFVFNGIEYKKFKNHIYVGPLPDGKTQKDLLALYQNVYGKDKYKSKYLMDKYRLSKPQIDSIIRMYNIEQDEKEQELIEQALIEENLEEEIKLNIDKAANVYTLSQAIVDNDSVGLSDMLNDLMYITTLNSNFETQSNAILDELDKILYEQGYQLKQEDLKQITQNNKDEIKENLISQDTENKAIEQALNEEQEEIQSSIKTNIDSELISDLKVSKQKEEKLMKINKNKMALDYISKLNWGDEKLYPVRLKLKKHKSNGYSSYVLNLPLPVAKAVANVYKKSKDSYKKDDILTNSSNSQKAKNKTNIQNTNNSVNIDQNMQSIKNTIGNNKSKKETRPQLEQMQNTQEKISNQDNLKQNQLRQGQAQDEKSNTKGLNSADNNKIK